MGKFKNGAFDCYERWMCNPENPDWESIGQANGVSADTAKAWALGWQAMCFDQDWIEEEPDFND